MKKVFCLILCLICANFCFSEYNSRGVPDSADLRKKLVETWFEASLDELKDKVPEFLSNAGGQKFKVYLEEEDTFYCIYVASGKSMDVNVFLEDSMIKEQQIVYPGNLSGTWVLIKDKKTNEPLRIRYFFTGDSDVFVQFSPNGRVALADLVIFGHYAAKGVSTGVPFSKIYTASFDDVMLYTKKSLPWNYVFVDSVNYAANIFMANEIEKNLSRITVLDDAMYNENNDLVSIIDGKPFIIENGDENANRLYLSSAGFVKWICDGLVYPITGGQLKRNPLIKETVKVYETGHLGVNSQKYSLYFTLDWIRNLSSAVVSVKTGKNYEYPKSSVDVTINPFASSMIGTKANANTLSYVKDTGYKTQILKSLLYVLAATEPDTFYLGAIRETDKTVSPELKVFNKCVVFFPYFTENQTFDCKVFIEGRYLSLQDFCQNYEDEYVYLTRMQSSQNFNLN